MGDGKSEKRGEAPRLNTIVRFRLNARNFVDTCIPFHAKTKFCSMQRHAVLPVRNPTQIMNSRLVSSRMRSLVITASFAIVSLPAPGQSTDSAANPPSQPDQGSG